MGSSGQPVKDISLYSDVESPLGMRKQGVHISVTHFLSLGAEGLMLSVRSRCLAPTAPDTLS